MLTISNYVKPKTLEEAYELNQARNSRVMGGMMWMRLGNAKVQTIIDISGLGLDQIEETDHVFRIGAMCTLRQLELLRREGVSEKEFREAKNQLRGSYLLGLESPGGRMQSMGRGQLHLGQCMTPEETIAKIEAVTQADVNAVAERIFAAEPCLSVVGKNASVYLAR